MITTVPSGSLDLGLSVTVIGDLAFDPTVGRPTDVDEQRAVELRDSGVRTDRPASRQRTIELPGR
jgi:hypothetical protein